MALATPISRARFVLAGLPGPPRGGLSQALADPACRRNGASPPTRRRNFQEAQARYRKAPGEATAAWQFGRACFDLAEFATNKTERASLAEQGIAACRAGHRARVQLGSGPLLPRHESRATGPNQRAGRAQARGPDGARVHPGARPGRAARLGRARSQPRAALPRRPGHRQHREPQQGAGTLDSAPWSWRPSIPRTG